jgi:hypothetical protein
MSRGFDGFDIDDFRDPQCESERYGPGRDSTQGRGSGSQSGGTVTSKLEKLREAESIGDQVVALSRQHPVAGRSLLPRETKQAALLAERDRTNYRERDRGYSLRQSEIHTLTEVAKFRVVAVEDLTKLAYSGDRSRTENDLRGLLQQGLVERRETSVLKKESRQVLTLTKQGQRLVRRQRFVPEDQAIYSGLVKPKEAGHDADLYRLYHKAADKIEHRGGKIVRVQLDYELKEELYRKLGRAQLQEKNEAFHLKHAFAQQLHLPVVDGKVSFPDLRIEYTNQEMEIARVDLELATDHYHAGHLAEKARAGFQIYARSEDVAGLRRVRDDREIMTAILSL